jgi:hypothetical protein
MAHRLAPEAEAELDDIWYYIATESRSIETSPTVRLIPSPTGFFFLPRILTSDVAVTKICARFAQFSRGRVRHHLPRGR